jgi:stress-induced morphogen
MQDLLGNEIKIGDMVAYPGRKSSSMWVSVGKVVEVCRGELYDDSLHRTTWNKWKVPKHLKVEIKSENWDGTIKVKRTTQVKRIDRVLIIPTSQFDEDDRKFFGLALEPMEIRNNF